MPESYKSLSDFIKRSAQISTGGLPVTNPKYLNKKVQSIIIDDLKTPVWAGNASGDPEGLYTDGAIFITPTGIDMLELDKEKCFKGQVNLLRYNPERMVQERLMIKSCAFVDNTPETSPWTKIINEIEAYNKRNPDKPIVFIVPNSALKVRPAGVSVYNVFEPITSPTDEKLVLDPQTTLLADLQNNSVKTISMNSQDIVQVNYLESSAETFLTPVTNQFINSLGNVFIKEHCSIVPCNLVSLFQD